MVILLLLLLQNEVFQKHWGPCVDAVGQCVINRMDTPWKLNPSVCVCVSVCLHHIA